MTENLTGTEIQKNYMDFFALPVEKHCVLLEAMQGKKFSHSMQALARVLVTEPEFQEYEVYVVCAPEVEEERKDYFKWIGAPGIKTVLYASEEYYRLLATAGVLINENSFSNEFIKKPEQTYIRVWNGIPMKPNGRASDTDYAAIGNAQRNLLCADYLVCPNEFTMKTLADNFMLSNIGKTKVLYAGRLQNEVFFDDALDGELRAKLGLGSKRILVYIPTISKEPEDEERLWETIKEWNERLSSDYMLYVSAPYALRENWEYASLEHVAFVPRGCGVLPLLAIAECFITDCSDLIFDFAITKRKQILFSYQQADEEMDEYYRLHPELPLFRAHSVEELVDEIYRPKENLPDAFFQTYCSHNRPGMLKKVLCKAILGEDVPELSEAVLPDNGKKNVLIYPGPLFKNGITSSILSLLEHLDREKNNYILFFRTEQVLKEAKTLKELPEGVAYYGYSNVSGVTLEEAGLYERWQNDPALPYAEAEPLLCKRMEREKQRLLDFCRIDTVIHYEGYGRDVLLLFELMSCRRIVYLHNNMLLEIEKKGIRPEPLCRAYHNYDVVALVSEEQRHIAEKMIEMDGGDRAKSTIVLAKNVIPYEKVLQGAAKEFCLDEKTELNVTEEELRQLLASQKKKFITIGRFLPEKAHNRLIRAFEKVHAEHPETLLIILGGYGPLYEETREQAADSTASDSIVIIKYLNNPYALLKQCDYFILSSYYEGLPVVLTEADIVGLPCVSTNIPGPRTMMGQYGGLLVEDSEQGVEDGMRSCLSEQAPERFKLDYPEYNKEAVQQFEAMLTERETGLCSEKQN